MGDEIDKELISSSAFDNPKKFFYESSHLRSIFPEEVWIAILDRVKLLIPEDLENWSNSSPYFRHLLEDSRVTFLFPKVFEILAPKYEERYPTDTAWLEQLQNNCYREDPVMINQGLDDDNYENDPEEWVWDAAHELTGIMNCRLVCRFWNKTIQNYYEDSKKPSGGSHFEMKYDRNRIQSDGNKSWDKIDLWKNCRFECHEPVATPQQFVNHFEETHFLKRNPFMGRSLYIQSYMPQDYNDDPEMHLYFTGLDELLGKYGEEVWYCEIELNEDETDPRGYPQLYLRLRRWITMMPNLRSLKIVQDLYPEEDWNSLEPLIEYFPQLMREIRENPLPKLEYLEFLSVEDLLAPIFNEIIGRNGHIVGLEMKRDEAHEKAYWYDLDYVLSGLPNLKRLGIHSLTEEELVKLEENMGGLRLENFQLTNSKGSPYHWGRLLGLVKGSNGTLTDLVLELPFVGNKEGGDILEMTKGQGVIGCIGKLERLVLFVGRPLFLDWILPVKNTLKRLELVVPPYLKRVKGYDKVVEEQGIELFGFEERMDKSNIWEIFEKLETVKIGKGYLSECEEWKEFTKP